MYHVGSGVGDGGGMNCSYSCYWGLAMGVEIYHAGGDVFYSFYNGQNSSPREGCSQTEVSGMKSAKFPPSDVTDC